ncbi:MAG: ATP-binding protein [Candidatus Eremiobacteraeota bacterium]|nr:ATP-binding protein [Candidatus Eremiobacteraeota bacterium]
MDKNPAPPRAPEMALDKEHLALLVRASELLGSSLNIHEILDRLMDQVIEVLKAERGFVMMRTGEGEPWDFMSARAIDREVLGREEFRISRGIVDRVAREGKAVLTSDAVQDSRFKGQASISLYALKSILCVPLIIREKVLGVIYVDNRMETGVFKHNEKSLLESIARQAAIALENALLYDELRRVHEESMEKARRELAHTQAQLFQSSKMAAVGQLAAGVAHEINNPIGAITLNVSSLKRDLLEEGLKRRLDIIEKAALRCKAIVEKLLRFSHPSYDTVEMIAVGDLVASTLELIEHQLSKENVAVERRIPGDLAVCGNQGEFSQVIMNILLNAKDALKGLPPGQPRLVKITTARGAGRVVIKITDNGKGMDEATRDRIFEPFFTTKTVGEGVGLGLSVCFQLMAKYGGEISVASEPGKGSVFTLLFRESLVEPCP